MQSTLHVLPNTPALRFHESQLIQEHPHGIPFLEFPSHVSTNPQGNGNRNSIPHAQLLCPRRIYLRHCYLGLLHQILSDIRLHDPVTFAQYGSPQLSRHLCFFSIVKGSPGIGNSMKLYVIAWILVHAGKQVIMDITEGEGNNLVNMYFLLLPFCAAAAGAGSYPTVLSCTKEQISIHLRNNESAVNPQPIICLVDMGRRTSYSHFQEPLSCLVMMSTHSSIDLQYHNKGDGHLRAHQHYFLPACSLPELAAMRVLLCSSQDHQQILINGIEPPPFLPHAPDYLLSQEIIQQRFWQLGGSAQDVINQNQILDDYLIDQIKHKWHYLDWPNLAFHMSLVPPAGPAGERLLPSVLFHILCKYHQGLEDPQEIQTQLCNFLLLKLATDERYGDLIFPVNMWKYQFTFLSALSVHWKPN